MAEMTLRKQSATHMEYAGHNPTGSLVAVIFGVGVFFLARSASGSAAGVAQGMAAFFVVVGILSALRRDRLRLELARRRWERCRGIWPVLHTTDGGFGTLRGVEVVQATEYRRGRPRAEWQVWLRFSNDGKSIRLLETSNEQEAKQMHAQLAAHLAGRNEAS